MKVTVKELQALCDKFNKEADGHNFVCPNNPDHFSKFMMEWKRDCKGDIKKLTGRTYLNECKWVNTADLGAYHISFTEMEEFKNTGNARRKKLLLTMASQANKDKPTELCCQCGGHFAQADMHKLTIENVPATFYICITCLDKMPRLTTQTEPGLN